MGLIPKLVKPTQQVLAKLWTEQGKSNYQKLIQTGNADISEDIQKHREIMGQGWFQEDRDKLTMPEIFSYPASPHLATRLDNREIDFQKLRMRLKHWLSVLKLYC